MDGDEDNRLLGIEGLRGASACWIMLFHCIIYSNYSMDFQGSSIMPLFFLLSGFMLTIAYSRGDICSSPYARVDMDTTTNVMVDGMKHGESAISDDEPGINKSSARPSPGPGPGAGAGVGSINEPDDEDQAEEHGIPRTSTQG